MAEAIILAVFMCLIADEDRRHLRVPAWINGAAGFVGMIVAIEMSIAEGQSVADAIIACLASAIACGASMLAVREFFLRARGIDGLGLGDVKLSATAGIWLGWEMFWYAILLSAICCFIAVAIVQLRTQGWVRSRRIPFAMALAPSVWLCWILLQITGGIAV
ncbi:prepilin peptidase [Aurantimonas sp. NFXS3]|uniref:prepilin peptidase n=1 Tax=Aurantimonas sp. NFXS3 TaxID=2818434 RepID=UPI003B8C2E27